MSARVRYIRGIRFTRGPGTKRIPGNWCCDKCHRRVPDGRLREHVKAEHEVAPSKP